MPENKREKSLCNSQQTTSPHALSMNDSVFTDVILKNGSTVRIEPITPHVFRVRLRSDDEFDEPGLTRYKIFRTQWPKIECEFTQTAKVATFCTSQTTLHVDKTDGCITLLEADGSILLQQTAPPFSMDRQRGFGAEFALNETEKLYGLGAVLNHSNHMTIATKASIER